MIVKDNRTCKSYGGPKVNLRKAETILPSFFFIGIVCHGIFFVREWLVLGGLFLFLYLVARGQPASPSVKASWIANLFFLTMIFLSLAGLLWPVRRIEGWLEAFRWLIYWVAYLWGTRLADKENKERILTRIVWVTLVCVILSWLPGSEKIWVPAAAPENGRYAFCFGYPNTAADFLFCQIMVLYIYRKNIAAISANFSFFAAFIPIIWGIMIVSLLFTGSRSSIILFLCFLAVMITKKAVLQKGIKKTHFRSKDKKSRFSKRNINTSAGLSLVFLILFFFLTVPNYENAILHLLNWTNTSLTERIVYFQDSLQLAWDARFLPQAGGWLGFVFVQSIPYWTLDPHSSFCRILLDQGLPGAVVVLLWAGKGIVKYGRDLLFEKDMDVIIYRTAALYLGLHSLIDADMLFGIVGIMFWLMIGMNRTAGSPAAYQYSD